MKRRVASLSVALLWVGLVGCTPYYSLYQRDSYREKTLNPQKYKGVAVIFPSVAEKNKLFMEAMGVELMKRGYGVIERQKIDKLIHEQLLAKGDFADLSDREKAIRLGKMLNADLVFYGDALVNQTTYVYRLSALGALASDYTARRAYELQEKANKTGVVEGLSDPSYEITSFNDVGVTAHAVDTATGEIVWVGYRLLASCSKVSEKDPTALSNFPVICKVCAALIDDFMGKTVEEPKKPR